ncbi:hypothetical protein [Peribacillus butanolivorans]|uniref:hypothetical protein n=1 Tax=Peribacillus butanolivorans TaxID=421767 RepID=UPI00380A0C07
MKNIHLNMRKESCSGFITRKHFRHRLADIGVDKKILNYIDKLNAESNEKFTFFVEIVNDELLFAIALINNKESEEYLKKLIEE